MTLGPDLRRTPHEGGEEAVGEVSLTRLLSKTEAKQVLGNTGGTWKKSLRVWELKHCSQLSVLPSWVFLMKASEGRRSRRTRCLGEGCGAMPASTPLTVPACGKENYSSRRQSEDVGVGLDTTTCSPSLVGWGPPYSNYWSSLAFFCLGCQDRRLHHQW